MLDTLQRALLKATRNIYPATRCLTFNYFSWRAPELKLASHFAYTIHRGSPIGKNLLAAQIFLITE
jgi:hypothetical protein